MTNLHDLVIIWATATALVILGAIVAAALASAARLPPLPPRDAPRYWIRSRKTAPAAAARPSTGYRVPAPRQPTTYASRPPAELLRIELDTVLGCTDRKAHTMPHPMHLQTTYALVPAPETCEHGYALGDCEQEACEPVLTDAELADDMHQL